MIKLILILIIIILLSLTLKKEYFSEYDDSSENDYVDDFVDSKDCNFLARGSTNEKCVNTCISSDLKNLFDKDNKCNETTCNSKCNQCDDKNLCQWIDTKNNPSYDHDEINLKIVTSSSNEIKLTWDAVGNINKYLIHYREANKPALHIIDNETNTSITFNISDKYIPTKNLKPNTNYEFIVYMLLTDEYTRKSNKLYVHT
jgi:hypothetical protein